MSDVSSYAYGLRFFRQLDIPPQVSTHKAFHTTPVATREQCTCEASIDYPTIYRTLCSAGDVTSDLCDIPFINTKAWVRGSQQHVITQVSLAHLHNGRPTIESRISTLQIKAAEMDLVQYSVKA